MFARHDLYELLFLWIIRVVRNDQSVIFIKILKNLEVLEIHRNLQKFTEIYRNL